MKSAAFPTAGNEKPARLDCVVTESDIMVGRAPVNLSARRSHAPRLLRRLGLAFGIVAIMLSFQSPNANASDWIYRRSYFSHDVPPEESGFSSFPRSRSAYRRAYVNTSPGYAVRGGYRINRIFMRSGNSTDLTVIREDWFQERP